MKTDVLEITKNLVKDLKSFIFGKVSDYLIEDAIQSENGFYFYLTYKEIENYETDLNQRLILEKEVIDFLKKNFNYKIN